VKVIGLRDRDEDDVLLTAIEFPERHRGWRQCRAQGNYQVGRILIRLFRDPWASPNQPPLAPQIHSHWLGEADRIEVEEIEYTKPLPILRVPFMPERPHIEVSLQALLDETYDTGRYPLLVEYDRAPDPPLTPEQQAWAEGVLRAKGLLP
jgi:hypothetical protein